MRIKYHPDGVPEPYVWDFEPGKLLVPEAEVIQKNTGLTYPDWVAGVQEAHPGAIRGFVWAMLKRHVEPTITWRQVVFPMDAVVMEYDEAEERAMLVSLLRRQRRGEEMLPGELGLIKEWLAEYGEPPATDDDVIEGSDDTSDDESSDGEGSGDNEDPFGG